MTTTRPVTELDFDTIKTDLINYIKSDPTFTDYAFEGSALNALMDVMAYNTHNLAYYANMLHNESFLDSAQKRASVVSKAKELGYIPKSVTCSTAYVDISLSGMTSGITSFSLPRGFRFSASNDNGTFDFLVVNDAISVIDGSAYKFKDIKIVAGTRVQNTFKVDTTTNIRSLFSIPNKNIDTSTLKVFVRDSAGAVERIEYFPVASTFDLTSSTRAYFIQEASDGYFQIYFGDNILGKQPVNGNYVDIDYFVGDDFAKPNICRIFTPLDTVVNVSSLNTLTTQLSYGGSDKEEIESIKVNATKSNSAKKRSVTESDYSVFIKENLPFVKSVSVWGGENNVPPVYGKVFISLLPQNGYYISETIKNDVIIPTIKSASIMTVTPQLVDPEYIIMGFTTKIKFNQFKTTTSQYNMEVGVKNAISSYIDSISSFGGDYIESVLTNSISAVDPGIVSVELDKMIGYKLAPITNVKTTFTKKLGNGVVPGSVESNQFVVVDSSGNVQTVTIKEVTGKTTVTLVNGVNKVKQVLGLYTDNGVLVYEIGQVDLDTGEFTFTFTISSFANNVRYILLMFQTSKIDVMMERNQVITILSDNTQTAADMNKVITEPYGK